MLLSPKSNKSPTPRRRRNSIDNNNMMLQQQHHHRHCNHEDTLRNKRRSNSISYHPQSAFDPTSSNQQMTLYMNRVPVVSPTTLHYQYHTRTVAGGAASHRSNAPKMDKTNGTGSSLAPIFPELVHQDKRNSESNISNTQILLQQQYHHHRHLQQPQAQVYCRPQSQAVVLKNPRFNLSFQQHQQHQQHQQLEVGRQYSKDIESNGTSRGRSVSICSFSSLSQQQQQSQSHSNETTLFSSTSLEQCFEQENHDVENTNEKEEEEVVCRPRSTDDSIILLQATTTESSNHDTSRQDVPMEENGSVVSFNKCNYLSMKDHYTIHEHEILIAAEILCAIKGENIKKDAYNTRERGNQKDYTRGNNIDGLSISTSNSTSSSSSSSAATTNNGEVQLPSSMIFQDLTKPPPKSAIVLSSKGELSPKRKRRQFVSVRNNNNGDIFVPSKFSKKTCNNKQRRISKQEIYDSIIKNNCYHEQGATGNTTITTTTNEEDTLPRDLYDDDCNDYNVQRRKKKKSMVPSKKGGKNNKKQHRRKSLPNRLALPNDPLEVNSLHCYVRSELLELFVVPENPTSANVSKEESSSTSLSRSTSCDSRTSKKRLGLGKYKKHDSSSDDNDYTDVDDEEYVPSGSRTRTCNNNRRSSRDHPSKSVCPSADSSSTIITTSTFRRNIPGRVGLRCLFCKPNEDDRKKNKNQSCTNASTTIATKADFYPKSIQMLYREVCTWQRVHFQHCQHVPQECREKYRYLKESDKSRGKTKYWETSARELGLMDVIGADGDYDGICFRDNM